MNFITFLSLMPKTPKAETALSAATGETRPNDWVDYLLFAAVAMNVLAAIVAPFAGLLLSLK